MEQDDGPVERWSARSNAAVAQREEQVEVPEWADLREWARWLERHGIMLAGVLLIVVQVIWRAQFLSRMYFRQDDFHVLDLALKAPFSWSYLTSVPSGHLSIGGRAVTWALARISLYNWPLYSALDLVVVACAGVAMLKLLRNLFGERPAILVLLALYLFSPLTVPGLGWWVTNLEALPMLLAIPLALNAQVNYVRTGRRRYMISAAGWVFFCLVFTEKGLILPLLLFAVTAFFLMGNSSAVEGLRRCLLRYWRVWLIYVALIGAYLAVLALSLAGSAQQPGVPTAAGNSASFAVDLLRYTFLPGALGGPWTWFPVAGKSYAFTAAPPLLAWLSLVAAAGVIVVSLLHLKVAWRAWAILFGWVLFADLLPVIVGRIGQGVFSSAILELESRYVADAVPVLAICVGLAFLPVSAGSNVPVRAARRDSPTLAQFRRTAAAVVGVAFVIGSTWSVQAYEDATTGAPARAFIENARAAMQEAPRGTVVLDRPVPNNLELATFGPTAYASALIGDMAPNEPASKLRWASQPQGTIDHLMAFGGDGRLHPAVMLGVRSLPRLAREACWPRHHGSVTIHYQTVTPIGTKVIRIGYLWYSPSPALVLVTYGAHLSWLHILPGLHSAYLPERGSVPSINISGFGNLHLCVGDIEAGVLLTSSGGPTIPPLPASP